LEYEIIPKIFISYSHVDKNYQAQLRKHFKVLERNKKLTIWDDHSVDLGAEWNREIMYNLETSDIIILLISMDFINSDFCYEIEMIRALDRHDKKDALVIPLIIRTCYWQETPFAKLQAIIPDGGAIDDKINNDSIWTKIILSINDQLIKWKNNHQKKMY
jgi:hypothetical protein